MMKNRSIRKLFCLLIALAACVPYGTAHAVNAEDVFYISFGNCIPGNSYVLMLLQPNTNVYSIQDSDLLFIDQYTAQSDSMEIALVYPDFDVCDAAVSGTFSDNAASPLMLGNYRSARLPIQLQTIEEEAFAGASFTHVYCGNRVTGIKSRAFADCANLSYIYISDSVTNIARDAFQSDNNLTIGCRKNSTACQFAIDNGISYILLD